MRRAFLWGRDELSGRDYSHRKQWVLDRLTELQRIFAIDQCAYAVMSNHYHVVLRVDRDRARGWSDDEIIKRWAQVFAVSPVVSRLRSTEQITDAERAKALGMVEVWRERLHNVSWFMRCLNEYLAAGRTPRITARAASGKGDLKARPYWMRPVCSPG